MSRDQGASPDGDRATHEPSPTVSALRVGIPSAEEKRLKSLAADHFRNACRLARLLVKAEDELRHIKKERGQ